MNSSESIISTLPNFFKNSLIFPFISLIIVGFFIRIYFGNYEIPLVFDAFSYFSYASDISINAQLPSNYSVGNNGWPIFLSGIFSIFEFNSVLEYMQIQKITTVVLSTITIIPVYFLCKKFFDNKLSFIGATIFAFEPRIILNSSLGITEPLYILLGTTAIVFFLSNDKKFVYGSFVITAFVSMIRTEGIFLFLPLSIIFVVRFRNEKFRILKYFIILGIFILILLPMVQYRIETMGHDGLSQRIINGIYGHILGSTNFSEQYLDDIGENSQGTFFIRGGENFVKFLGWDLVPIFIFFVPIGIFLLFKNMNFKKGVIILNIIFLSIPVFYAYSIPLEDTRYFFFLYPMLCVISLFTIEKIRNQFNNKILIFIVLGIVFSSLIFLNFKSIDYEHERDAFEISKILLKYEITINEYKPESQYLESANILNNYEKFEDYFFEEREKRISVRDQIPKKISLISLNGYSSVEEFIEKNRGIGLSHIIVDDQSNRPLFMKKIFENESNFPFLIKEFDSKEKGFSYHLKLFKIDFEKYEKYKIN